MLRFLHTYILTINIIPPRRRFYDLHGSDESSSFILYIIHMAIAILPSSTIFGTNFSVRIEIPMRIVSVESGMSIAAADHWLGSSPVSPRATQSSMHPRGSNESGKSLHQHGRGGQILCPSRRENAASDR